MPNHNQDDISSGTIPNGWDVASLEEVVEFTKKPKDIQLPMKIPFIPMDIVPQGRVYIDKWELRDHVTSGVYCERGDILLPKITPSFENGKQGIVGEVPGGFAFTTTEVIPIKAKAVDSLFLFFYFLQKNIRKDLAAKMEGTTGRQRIPKSVISSMPLSIPTRSEQRAIAQALNTVRESIEAAERVITTARELKRSLMKYLFTYGPVPIDHADQVVLKDTEFGEIPENWDLLKVENVTRELRDRNTQLIFSRGEVLSVSNTEGFVPSDRKLGKDFSRYKKVKHKQFGYNPMRLNVGSIAFRKALNPGIVSPDYIVFEAIDDKLLPEYFNHFRNTDYWWKQIHMSGQGSVRIRYYYRHIKDFDIPIPSMAIQKEISSILDAVDEKTCKEIKRKESLESFFTSLLHNLMTGKIRVNDEEL